MLNLDDARWTEMKGGYRVPYDPRPAFLKLESGDAVSETWDELWQELYHQGHVGEASYASVPHIVRIHRQRNSVDWNTYAIVATIELARDEKDNPDVPAWLKNDYEEALVELAHTGLTELSRTEDKETVRAILSVIALWRGLRTYGGRLLVDFSDDEVLELEKQAFGEPDNDLGRKP